jgi:hypothetical protein
MKVTKFSQQFQSTSGLYYKHTTIVNYACSIVNKLETLLTDDARVVIYDLHVFIVQATDQGYNTRTENYTLQNYVLELPDSNIR